MSQKELSQKESSERAGSLQGSQNQKELNHGFMSIDIGEKHMAACFTVDFEHFQVFIYEVEQTVNFEQSTKSLLDHMQNIINIIGKENINKVIIEQQLPRATKNIMIQGKLGGFFYSQGIHFTTQQASIKYSHMKNNIDKRNYKAEGVKEISEILDKIEVKYQGQTERKIKNHLWLSDEMRNWLKKNKVDKFDDIADTILILKAYLQQHPWLAD